MEKIIAKAPMLIKRAMAGDVGEIALLSMAGISIVKQSLQERKK